MGQQWVAFIQAMNGSPHNRVRMADLAAMLADVGCHGVTWHLQTGNMLFAADAPAEELAATIQERLEATGMRNADVLLRTPADLAALVARTPFAGLDGDAWQFEATFLRRPAADPDLSELVDGHGVQVRHQDDGVVCFAFPRGGRMDGGFNGWIERRWKVPATSRAWNVVEDVAAKAASLG